MVPPAPDPPRGRKLPTEAPLAAVPPSMVQVDSQAARQGSGHRRARAATVHRLWGVTAHRRRLVVGLDRRPPLEGVDMLPCRGGWLHGQGWSRLLAHPQVGDS